MTNVFEVRFGQETRIGEDQLTIKSKPHSEERGLFGESYDRMSPLLGGQVFQRDGIRFGFVRRAINGDLEKKTSDAYDEILGCLGDTELYRCWNFVPQINVETEGTENYKLFNAGRRQAFDRHYGTDSTKRIIENVYTVAPSSRDSRRVQITSAPSAPAPDNAIATYTIRDPWTGIPESSDFVTLPGVNRASMSPMAATVRLTPTAMEVATTISWTRRR